jgi:hypothetical protein
MPECERKTLKDDDDDGDKKIISPLPLFCCGIVQYLSSPYTYKAKYVNIVAQINSFACHNARSRTAIHPVNLIAILKVHLSPLHLTCRQS